MGKEKSSRELKEILVTEEAGEHPTDAPSHTTIFATRNDGEFGGIADEADQVEETVIDVGPGVWPERFVSYISRLSFWWVGELLVTGKRKPLEQDDLWEMDEWDNAEAIAELFQKNWRLHSPSLVRTLHHAYAWRFYSAAILKLCYDALQFVGPVLLGSIIRFLGDPSQPLWVGFVFMAVLLVVYTARSLIIQHYFHLVFRSGMRIRSGIVSAIYRHSLSMSQAEKAKHSTGAIVDLMSNDAQKMMELTTYLHVIWSGPLQITVALVLLARLIGWATLAGLVVMIVLIPINAAIGRWSTKLRNWMMEHTDERVRWMNEVLQSIKGVKLQAYEKRLIAKLQEVRKSEVYYLTMRVYLLAVNQTIAAAAPLIVSVLSLGLYGYLGNEIQPDVVFPAIALFGLLRFPLQVFPNMVSDLANAKSSVRRIQEFLTCRTIDMSQQSRAARCESGDTEAIAAVSATVGWAPDAEPFLHDISLSIPRGATVGVIGSVGAGKSCLLHAMLGELSPQSGTVCISGTVAYVPQQAWIINATLRDNILFGAAYDEKRYHEVLAACAMLPDLELLPAGDMTEIGERGINLSGGQKQRVSIARAVYSGADVVLLDDPLSALDSNVARHVFREAISGLLAEKTVVLVTHYLHLLPTVDHVVVLERGRVAEQGTYRQLIASGGVLQALVEEHSKEGEEREAIEDGVEVLEEAEVAKEAEAMDEKQVTEVVSRITEKEERDTGAVSWRMYWVYALAPGSLLLVLIMLGTFILAQAARIGTDSFVVVWSNHEFDWTQNQYILAYFGLCALSAVIAGISRFLMNWLGLRAAVRLHDRLLHSIFHAPVAFFESTPTGRILNRFSKDQESVDASLPRNMSSFINVVVTCTGTLLMMVAATPLILLGLLPLGGVFYYVQSYYRSSSRELKRLDSISRSPIYAHFSESLEGLVSIRAYGAGGRFVAGHIQRLDGNQRAYFAMVTANRWLGVRLELITTAVVTLVCLATVLERNRVDASVLGLVLGYTVITVSWFSWLVRSTVDLEQQMNSIERILYYTDLEPEGAAIDLLPETADEARAKWPTFGRISFEDVVLRYRESLPPALRGLSFTVEPGEKVGVVGRTGAGKSSLFVALLRLVELESGRIVVDGVDLASLRLHTLRSRITIIPQDPVLFTGTVRSNLDPFEEFSDERLWKALSATQLREAIEALDGGLGAPVSEVGGGFSVGQRQLLCFARALLKDATILLLDEATASCDMATDALIQTTLREHFAHSTVITIAHRLNTIMDSDKVLVMDGGVAVEYDAPHKLLTGERAASSTFASLVNETGEANAAHLRSIAEQKAKRS